MNESATLWQQHPEWGDLFTEADRTLVDSWLRYGLERAGATNSEDLSPDLVVALLHLVRSLRFDHVALALDEVTLATYLLAATSVEGESARADAVATARRLVAALTDQGALARALVQIVDLHDDVDACGGPLVVSRWRGEPAFAHVRRLAWAENRLALTLLEAVDEIAPWRNEFFADNVLSVLGDEEGARAVAATMMRHRVSVVTGGPGTGKTTAVARALQALGDTLRGAVGDDQDVALTVALCAPTAKAAVRLRQAVHEAFVRHGGNFEEYGDVLRLDPSSGSVHGLLGLRPDRVVAFDTLSADLIIVDEVSMLELPLLDQLLERAAPTARVVLVGDADQLASVNVGAALRDVVDGARDNGPLAPLVTQLTKNFRSNNAVQELATAMNEGDVSEVWNVAATHGEAITIVSTPGHVTDHVTNWSRDLATAARNGERDRALGLLGQLVVLCATRQGSNSVAWWRRQLEPEIRRRDDPAARFAVGTPVLVTRNEYGPTRDAAPQLSNGDVGVVVRDRGVALVAFPGVPVRQRQLLELPDAESAWAITIHKSQGSEYDEAVISLPDYDSAILTRELLYTAVTRARTRVTVIAGPGVLERALARRISRVSALRERMDARCARRDGEPVAQ